MTQDTGKSLKGLNGVAVLIEDLEPPVGQTALTKTDIQTDVELKLRLAGIPVLANSEAPAYLYVNVNVLANTAYDLWPYSIQVELKQTVLLERDPATLVVGTATWGTAGISAAGRLALRRVIRENVNDRMTSSSTPILR